MPSHAREQSYVAEKHISRTRLSCGHPNSSLFIIGTHAAYGEPDQGFAAGGGAQEAGMQALVAGLGPPGGDQDSSWLAAVLEETMPLQTSSRARSGLPDGVDSLGAVSSLADSLASTASTVSSMSGARPSSAHDTGPSCPDFSWESSFGRSTFPGSWPSLGTTHAPGASGYEDAVRAHEIQHGHASEQEAERGSRVGPMLQGAASRQGGWPSATASSTQGRPQRHAPYARPNPDHAGLRLTRPSRNPTDPAMSNFDELRSFNHANCQTIFAASTIPASSGAPDHHPAGTTVLDDADLTLGPGDPTRPS